MNTKDFARLRLGALEEEYPNSKPKFYCSAVILHEVEFNFLKDLLGVDKPIIPDHLIRFLTNHFIITKEEAVSYYQNILTHLRNTPDYESKTHFINNYYVLTNIDTDLTPNRCMRAKIDGVGGGGSGYKTIFS